MLENEKSGIEPEELRNPKLTTLPADTETEEILSEVEENLELSDEEKKEIYIQQLKDSRIRFHPLSHPTKTTGIQVVGSPILPKRKREIKTKTIQTNLTVNQFGAEYRKKRQRKNKMAKASRKANR